MFVFPSVVNDMHVVCGSRKFSFFSFNSYISQQSQPIRESSSNIWTFAEMQYLMSFFWTFFSYKHQWTFRNDLINLLGVPTSRLWVTDYGNFNTRLQKLVITCFLPVFGPFHPLLRICTTHRCPKQQNRFLSLQKDDFILNAFACKNKKKCLWHCGCSSLYKGMNQDTVWVLRFSCRQRILWSASCLVLVWFSASATWSTHVHNEMRAQLSFSRYEVTD